MRYICLLGVYPLIILDYVKLSLFVSSHSFRKVIQVLNNIACKTASSFKLNIYQCIFFRASTASTITSPYSSIDLINVVYPISSVLCECIYLCFFYSYSVSICFCHNCWYSLGSGQSWCKWKTQVFIFIKMIKHRSAKVSRGTCDGCCF